MAGLAKLPLRRAPREQVTGARANPRLHDDAWWPTLCPVRHPSDRLRRV